MCLIIDAPSAASIPQDLLESAWTRNKDGWGTMHTDGGRIHVAHGMKLKALKRAVAARVDRPITVHLRWATCGTIGVENCHPFATQHGGYTYAVAHNGVLGVERTDPGKSDTYHWTRDTLPQLLDAAEFTAPGFRKLAEAEVGRTNKLVILRDDGAKVVLNQPAGCRWNGLWLSNDHSLPYQPELTRAWAAAGPVWTSNPLRSPGRSDRWEDSWEEAWSPDLEDLAALNRTDLRDYCRSHPGLVADLILERFA